MERKTRLRYARGGVICICCVPLASLAVGSVTDGLGANPIETITHVTGEWGLRFLLAALAITPLRTLTGWAVLASYRRTFGLLSFTHASVHLATWLSLDHFFDWAAMAEDVIERPHVTAGLVGFLCMLPLAITATRGWVRHLGRRWMQLHRLVYVAGVAAVVHYLWLVKEDLRPPLVHAAVLALLLGLRLWFWWRRHRTRSARATLDSAT